MYSSPTRAPSPPSRIDDELSNHPLLTTPCSRAPSPHHPVLTCPLPPSAPRGRYRSEFEYIDQVEHPPSNLPRSPQIFPDLPALSPPSPRPHLLPPSPTFHRPPGRESALRPADGSVPMGRRWRLPARAVVWLSSRRRSVVREAPQPPHLDHADDCHRQPQRPLTRRRPFDRLQIPHTMLPWDDSA